MDLFDRSRSTIAADIRLWIVKNEATLLSKFSQKFQVGKPYLVLSRYWPAVERLPEVCATPFYEFEEPQWFYWTSRVDQNTVIIPPLSPVIYLGPYIEPGWSPERHPFVKILWNDQVLLLLESGLKEIPVHLQDLISNKAVQKPE